MLLLHEDKFLFFRKENTKRPPPSEAAGDGKRTALKVRECNLCGRMCRRGGERGRSDFNSKLKERGLQKVEEIVSCI